MFACLGMFTNVRKKACHSTFAVWQKLYYFLMTKFIFLKTPFQIKSRQKFKKKMALKSILLNKIIIRQRDAKPENVLRY